MSDQIDQRGDETFTKKRVCIEVERLRSGIKNLKTKVLRFIF